jgi:DNA-binding transcriptional MerR regulator
VNKNIIEEKFYYRIGEVAKYLNVNTSLLRFWEKEFSQFINPNRNKRGVRLYDKKDFDLFIQLHTMIKIEGLTLKGAKDKLFSDKKSYKDKNEIVRVLTDVKEFLQEIKKNFR